VQRLCETVTVTVYSVIGLVTAKLTPLGNREGMTPLQKPGDLPRPLFPAASSGVRFIEEMTPAKKSIFKEIFL